MKKLISIVLCAVVFVSMFSFSTFAASAPSSSQKKCEEEIINALWNMKSSLDVSKYNFRCTLSGGYAYCTEIDDIMRKIYYHYPEINCYANTSLMYTHSNGKVKKITFSYKMSKDKMLEKREYLSDMATYMYNKINPSWSDMQKVLYVHDFIVANYCYDNRWFTDRGEEIHDMLLMFEQGTGVCQAYAYAMIFFLRQIDIKSYMAISNEDNHGWNVVQVDGKWYHVDATHDDPVYNQYQEYDSFGTVKHNKFLLSDVEINDGNHDNWYIPFKIDEGNIYCSKYNGPDLYKEALSSVVPMDDGYWYYIDYDSSNGGLRKTKDFYSSQLVNKIDGVWDIRGDNYGYYGCYTGLFEYNGNLFFSDEKNLYTYDPEDNRTVAVLGLTPSAQSEYGRFFGFQMIDEQCYFIVTKDLYFNNVKILQCDVCYYGHAIEKWVTSKEATMFTPGLKELYCDVCLKVLEEYEIPKLSIPYGAGDTDGDGKVNTTDLALLKLKLAGINKTATANGADFNKDGNVDSLDLALLKLYLAYY